jgi:hypothetical protein
MLYIEQFGYFLPCFFESGITAAGAPRLDTDSRNGILL